MTTLAWRSFAAILLLTGCVAKSPPGTAAPVLPQPGIVQAEGPYRHAGSGLVFPVTGTAAGAAFARTRITQFDDKGGDVGGNYDLYMPSGRMLVSTYVYPVPLGFRLSAPAGADKSIVQLTEVMLRNELCLKELGLREQEVFDTHPEARLLSEGEIRPPHGEAGVPGKVAVFETDDFINKRPGPVRSELYLFCYVGDLWIVKYRATPVRDAASEAILAAFMSQVPWGPTTPR
jgi:hypothetical protein